MYIFLVFTLLKTFAKHLCQFIKCENPCLLLTRVETNVQNVPPTESRITVTSDELIKSSFNTLQFIF